MDDLGRRRAARRLHRPRLLARAARRLAGEHQAGPPLALLASSCRSRVAAGRGSPAPSTCRRCSAPGARGCRPSGCTWSPCRRAASRRPTAATRCGAASARSSASIPPGRRTRAPAPTRSLGVAESQVIRQLNARLERGTDHQAEYDVLIRQLLAQERLVERPSAPVRLPPQRARLGHRDRGALAGVPRAERRRRRRRPARTCAPPPPTPRRPGTTPTRYRRASGSASRSTPWPR